MATIDLLAPLSEDSPCGADLQWDADMLAMEQTMLATRSEEEAVVEGEQVARDAGTFDDVLRLAEGLCARTKDLRVLATLAEARWRTIGISAFADTMADLAAIVETWPDGRNGVHPRADEEDGDLGERAAPLGKLLYGIPDLVRTVGWGPQGEGTGEERLETGQNLRHVFTRWEERLGPALGASLPSVSDAWQALRPYAPSVAENTEEATEMVADEVTPTLAKTVDPWDLIERAEDLMQISAPHSPALPVLGMLLRWREKNIIDVMLAMRASGVTLEQLLEAIRVQMEQPA